jgi:hypothetical protein
MRSSSVAIFALTTAIAACSSPPRSPVPPPAGSLTLAPSSVASANPAPPPRAPREEPAWVRARSGDPLDRARLAIAVGALALVEAVEQGGPDAELGLSALPSAPDGALALARLGALAESRAGKPDLAAILAAIRGVVAEPSPQREALDAEGERACAESLARLVASTAINKDDRALAVSALHALAERGAIDPARIPTIAEP